MREVDRVAIRVRSLLGDGADGVIRADAVYGGDVAHGAEQPHSAGGQPSVPPSVPPRPAGLASRLAARFPMRIDPGRRPALAVGVAVLVVALVTGAWVLAQRPQAAPVSAKAPALSVTATPSGTGAPAALPGPSASSGPPSPSASAIPSVVVVDVAGKVHRPGLYHLPAGARIDDAVRAAGGALPRVDLSSLNLAASLVDGQQIRVGLRGAAPAGDPAAAPGSDGTGTGTGTGSSTGAGAGTSGSPGALVDLNTATLDQLDALPGVGPVLAQHVVDWRTAHGSFSSVDQLNDVSGIGEVKFADLRSLVTV